MRFSLFSLSLLGLRVSALPSLFSGTDAVAALAKRQTNDEVIGYASLNGGTTGGGSAPTTTVTTFDELVAAVAGDEAKTVIVSGTIKMEAAQVNIGSNTSLLGKDSGAILIGFGVLVKGKTNVIIRNLTIQKVLEKNGDAIGVSTSTNVWIDHVDLSSEMTGDKNTYDGLIDVTTGSDYITISNSFIHDHHKASLVGNGDDTGSIDSGKMRVTFHNNYFLNVGSRAPLYRWGSGHVFNSYFEDVPDGIHVRSDAQVLVESNTWAGDVNKAIFSTSDGTPAGHAVERDNDFGGATTDFPVGTLTKVPYDYTLLGPDNVAAAVKGSAGAKLKF
ncbi:uncharacterized protein L3040_005199 [Drepanopeziza brunnea f. sp. 'multigermtubi']|uniref:uncharacterized protein n=1 Tax=Drepanopeziza brunnea f. sp. 'multigermtubi' TaxID=698441 RepID=UPI0023A48BC5|nr:hypothetical protein L3040_005199 [Drepanopeziza brunnea f. sp. 'multigermtubi']